MRKTFIIIIVLLVSQFAAAEEIDFINLDLFGKSIDEPIKILEKGTSIKKEYRPITVTLDHNASKYYAAQVEYDKLIGFDKLREALSNKYQIAFSKPENNFTFGRSKKYGFACQLFMEEDGLKVIYIWLNKIAKNEQNEITAEGLKKMNMEGFTPLFNK
jgi:hypothetical protein